MDDATEGEEELLAQLTADPALPSAWAAVLADEAQVLEVPSANALQVGANAKRLVHPVRLFEVIACITSGARRAGPAAVMGGPRSAAPCQAGGNQAVQALEVHVLIHAVHEGASSRVPL